MNTRIQINVFITIIKHADMAIHQGCHPIHLQRGEKIKRHAFNHISTNHVHTTRSSAMNQLSHSAMKIKSTGAGRNHLIPCSSWRCHHTRFMQLPSDGITSGLDAWAIGSDATDVDTFVWLDLGGEGSMRDGLVSKQDVDLVVSGFSGPVPDITGAITLVEAVNLGFTWPLNGEPQASGPGITGVNGEVCGAVGNASTQTGAISLDLASISLGLLKLLIFNSIHCEWAARDLLVGEGHMDLMRSNLIWRELSRKAVHSFIDLGSHDLACGADDGHLTGTLARPRGDDVKLLLLAYWDI